MHDIKKNIRRVFWLYFALFLTVVVYLGNFILIESAGVINSTFNPRLNFNDSSVKRGYIFDANGIVLSESLLVGNLYRRNYPFANDFAHTVGAIGITKSGIEARYNFNLYNLDFEIIQRLQREFSGGTLRGDNVHLTLEQPMQRLAAESLRGISGAVVAMEPATGRIIAMASSPDFNPNNLSDLWRDLVSDEENSPLLNRATGGLYPPGSVFKIVTAEAIMNHMHNFEDFYVDCTGVGIFNGESLRCFDSRAHGRVNLSAAMKHSCNIFFAEALIEIGYDKLIESAEQLGFNQNFSFDIDHSRSRFSMSTGADIGEIIQTSIGQGRTLTTPLHMALVTSAVANGGVVMEPFIAERVSSHTGRVKWEARPSVLGQLMGSDNAERLSQMLVEAVEDGTGRAARIPGIAVAGKTGTAENPAGAAHGWFMCFAPAEQPEIVLAIVTERTGGTAVALEIARNMLSRYFAG